MSAIEIGVFDEVGEVLRGLLPANLGDAQQSVRRHGIKVWFGPGGPPREHYEAQLIGAGDVPGARVLALEIGFHSEHPKAEDNDAVLARLTGAAERRWRKTLGSEPQVGAFLGRATAWRGVRDLGRPGSERARPGLRGGGQADRLRVRPPTGPPLTGSIAEGIGGPRRWWWFAALTGGGRSRTVPFVFSPGPREPASGGTGREG
jgi:hypothetical protein